MTDWGGYTRGSFVPKVGGRTFSDVLAQASPAYVSVVTLAGPTTPNGRAKPLAGHRYGTHRWTDPYTPPIAAYPMNPKLPTAAIANTNPNKLSRLTGSTLIVASSVTPISTILQKNSTGQYS